MIERLGWDSSFFGLRIGRAFVSSKEEVEALAAQINLVKENYDLVYVFASHGLTFAASNAKLVDQKVVYELPDLSGCAPNSNVILWDSGRGVSEDLLYLAIVSGKYSRYKLDKSFPMGSYERLYSRWIEQSVNHALATEVFCYMEDQTPRGLITLNIDNYAAIIGLVAIHEDYQHQGIGTAMMRHVVHYAQEHCCERLSVATQLDNIPACRLYEKSGFAVESITDVWHWWL